MELMERREKEKGLKEERRKNRENGNRIQDFGFVVYGVGCVEEELNIVLFCFFVRFNVFLIWCMRI